MSVHNTAHNLKMKILFIYPVLKRLLPGLRGYVTSLTGRALEWHSSAQQSILPLHQKHLTKGLGAFLLGGNVSETVTAQ